ncbi:hypothetical protein O9A_01204 [Bartonella koehlerae C-29]|uniref:Uncharacterized protein n=1 Tax=Bartonella koehlerae C-29 TaxID=1134510 RepID=A0A067W3Y8_9HYPH|nr:hypothetical protein O9A_01204 [Bartonella koehlerae C-29]
MLPIKLSSGNVKSAESILQMMSKVFVPILSAKIPASGWNSMENKQCASHYRCGSMFIKTGGCYQVFLHISLTGV